ncbi:MAG: DNA primase, partial [Betaproteobacteria bacterium]|nr:DNA primase [Betaproteobacteria bacterium]
SIQPPRRTDTIPANTSAYGSSLQQPPLSRRAPPPPAATLLRLVLQHPALAARLPIDLIPNNTDEGRALIAIIDLVELGEPITGLAALCERFRDTPHGETLNRIAVDPIETEFAPSAVEPQFQDTLHKLQADVIAREIAELTEQARTGTLSPTERQRLTDLLKENKRLPSFTKSADL